MHCLPTGLKSLLLSPFRSLLLKALWKDIFNAARQNSEDESVHDFISRRLGTEFSEMLMDPMISGIYAGDIRKLSMQATFPQFFQWEKEHGSLWRGAFHSRKAKSKRGSKNDAVGICTLKGGMEALIAQLEKNLNQEMRFGSPVKRLHIEDREGSVELANGEFLHADAICLSVPAKALAAMLHSSANSRAQNIAQQLNAIPTAPLAVVNVGYRQQVLQKNGFGHLIPSKAKEEILGIIWDSSAFPEQSQGRDETRLTVMIGGAHMPHFHRCEEKDFVSIALRGIQKQLGIEQYPDAMAVKISPEAIPQYQVGHQKAVIEIKEQLRVLCYNLHLLGNSYEGISLNDCVRNSESLSLALC